ncbi:hypothetical protein ACXJJ3_30915 [Kribbella sp. WER1]
MNWGGVPNAGRLAVAYLVAFPAMVAGIALVLIAQITGHQAPAIPGGVLFVAGQLVITGLSFALRDVVPPRPGRQRERWQLAWNRLSLGLELARARRVLVK